MRGDDIFVAGPRQDMAKMGATLKKRWETRDQIGPKPDDQKELGILNRALRRCKDGLVFANLRHGREVIDELGLSKSKPVSSPATADGAARCKDDEFKPLDEEEKRLCQRIVAKLNYFAHDRSDLKYATSGLASAVSSPGMGDMRAAKRVGRYLRKAPVAWEGFPFHDPWLVELLCYTDADRASDKTSRRSTSGGVVTLGGGVLNCRAKKQKSVALSSWESERFAAITSGTRSLGIQSQSVVDHSRRRGHSVASKRVGLRGLWLQEALELEKWILRRIPLLYAPKRYREIGFASCVGWLGCTYAAVEEETWVTIPTNGSWVVWMTCAEVRNSSSGATLSLKGRVDITCLHCFSQTHFASAVGHESVDPKCRTLSIM